MARFSNAATSEYEPAGSEICRQSAKQAALATGVPLSVLRAISLTETGRKQNGKFLSWPWTVNMEGKGRWFNNKTDALQFAASGLQRGARSFDIGCFQINYRWHGRAFRSIEQMFDPNANALYAARYLLRLFQEKGSWNAAAGAYHSRTSKYAKPYAARFSRIRARLAGENIASINKGESRGTKATRQRTNNFPLLKLTPNAVFANGSLVALFVPSGGKTLIVRSRGRLF